jgi:hypothetical protein
VTDHELVLTRGTNQEWVSAQKTGPINQVNVQSLLNTLTKLRAVRWLGSATAVHGLDKPQLAITFSTSPDDKALHKLLVGGPAGDGMWFARADDRDGTFVINNPDFNALRLPLAGTSAPERSSPGATPAPSASAIPTSPASTAKPRGR